MKKIIPIIIGAVVVVGGATIILSGKDDSSKNTSSSGSKTNQSSLFDAQPTAGASFSATMTTTDNKGVKTMDGLMEFDAKSGLSKFIGKIGDQTMTMIYSKDAYYVCQSENECFKYSTTQSSSSGFNPNNFQYDDSKLSGYKTTAKSVGTKSCPSGTCNVWTVDNAANTKMYIDTKTKRVSQFTSSTDQGSTKVVYSYKDVSIAIPANAKDISNLGIPAQ